MTKVFRQSNVDQIEALNKIRSKEQGWEGAVDLMNIWGKEPKREVDLVLCAYNEDADIINAGKQTITTLPGASFFDSATSFNMIRGQHVDLTILGAMEVSDKGDIANWKIPGKMVKGMGGAMDLVASAENIIVAMMHTNRAGESKLLRSCSLPLTGVACVKKIVTNLAVLEVTPDGFLLLEYAPGVSIANIKEATAGRLLVSDDVKEMHLD